MAAHAAYTRTTNLSTHLLTAQKNKTKSNTKESTFRKMKVLRKRCQENGPKANKDKTERVTGQGRRTREEI